MSEVGEMIRLHGPMVWRVIGRYVGGMGRSSACEDCFQDVFVSALEVEAREKVRNWEGLLKRLAVSRSMLELRRRITERRRLADTDCDEIPGRLAAEGQAAIGRELAAKLRQALADLPEQQAVMFCLKYIEGMTYEEIGRQLGLQASAAGVGIHRTKLRLRELMGDEATEPSEVRHDQ